MAASNSHTTVSGDPAAAGTPGEATTWAALPCRTTLIARGPDAVRFLDGFTTAAIGRLGAERGAEGFCTDQRGWVLALVTFFREADGVRIDAAPGLGPRLVEHLERYHIREDFELTDVSATRRTFLVAGGTASQWLAGQVAGELPTAVHDHRAAIVGGEAALLARTDWYGVPGFLVQVDEAAAAAVRAWLVSAGLPEAAAAALDAARIEAGSPEAVDIPEKTLPQELGRDTRAISFTKGCYLGQETVARLDALGHVNRKLVGLACAAAVPPGAAVTLGGDGERVGTVTSVCRSPRLGSVLAMGIVHARGLEPAASLAVDGVAARVVPFPGAAVE